MAMTLAFAANDVMRARKISQPVLNPASGPNASLCVKHGPTRLVVVTGELGERQNDRQEQNPDNQEQPGTDQAGTDRNLAWQGKDSRADYSIEDNKGGAKKTNVTLQSHVRDTSRRAGSSRPCLT